VVTLVVDSSSVGLDDAEVPTVRVGEGVGEEDRPEAAAFRNVPFFPTPAVTVVAPRTLCCARRSRRRLLASVVAVVDTIFVVVGLLFLLN